MMTKLTVTILCLVLFICPVFPKTALLLACESYAAAGAKAVYRWNTCVTVKETAINFNQSAVGCDEFSLGHLLALPVKQMVEQLAQIFEDWSLGDINVRYFVGAHQANSTDEPAGHFEWHLAAGRKANMLSVVEEDVWATNEPNNDWTGEECTEYIYNEGLNDVMCTELRGILCQYDDPGKATRHFKKEFAGKAGHPAGRLGEYFGLVNAVQCAEVCETDPICHSLSWNNDGTCLLNSDDGTHPSYPPEDKNGYDMFVWKI